MGFSTRGFIRTRSLGTGSWNVGADGSRLERRVSDKATWDRNLARQGFRSESVFP